MTTTDLRGEPVSTDDRAALDRFETALRLLNGYYADPLAEIEAALAERPDFALGHCLRAGLFLISTERGAEPELSRSVEALEGLAPAANDRERGHAAAARAWLDGDFKRAVDLYGRVLEDHPRDLLALQLAHQCDFFLGQTTELRDRVARVLPFWDEDAPGRGYVLGMHAFGLEENNQFRQAEETGRHALSLEARDPWAVHAVAHVMEMEGRLAEGVDWLEGRRGDWAEDNLFAFHNWWHLGLYNLDMGRVDRVLDLYDTAIRPSGSTVALEMVDASAMLWRLHLRGADVGPRWAALAEGWQAHAGDAYYAFNDAHAVMAFVGAGRDADADRVIAAAERRAMGTGTNAALTREVGLPFCRALRAFGAGRYDEAVDLLLPVRPIAHRFGGSNAQRDVIALTLVEAALRAGRSRLAVALAAERTAAKPTSPFNRSLAARARAAAA